MCSKCVHNRPSQKDGASPLPRIRWRRAPFFSQKFLKIPRQKPPFSRHPDRSETASSVDISSISTTAKTAAERSGSVEVRGSNPLYSTRHEALFFKGFRTLRSKAFFVPFSDFLKYFSNTPRKQARGVPLFCQKPRRNYPNIFPTFSAAARSFCSSKCPYMSSVVEVRECPSRREVIRISPPPRSKRLA